MKKNELTRVHSLLMEIATDYHDSGVLTNTDLEPYSRLGIAPMTLWDCRVGYECATRTPMTTLTVCAAHDLDHDAETMLGRHLPQSGETVSTDADQRALSY